MMRAFLSIVGVSALLAACGEKPQTASHKPDLEPWRGQATAFTAPGWKQDDQASWELQIRQRNQGQNEYTRTQTKP